MRKIPSLFLRDYEGDRKVLDEVNPDCQWVVDGEGVATRKWDGLAVLVKSGQPYTRYDAKSGRTPPADFEPAQPAPDPVSGHWPGWIPAVLPAAKYVFEALDWARENLFEGGDIPDGTYEAVGPKIGTRHGANPEKLSRHILVVHGADVMDVPTDFSALMDYLEPLEIEGIVWHHPDGRMAKIKRNDFPYAAYNAKISPK